MPNIKKLSSIALLSIASLPVNAASFEFENFNLEWDSVFTAGAQYRIQNQKKHLSFGGDGTDGQLDSLPGLIDNAFILNSNDGNNNFNKGITSMRVSILSEADFNFGDWGVFVRGKMWHDFMYGRGTDMSREAWAENNTNPTMANINGYNSTYGHHNPATAQYAESGKRLLDFFWYGKFDMFDREISVRLGRQVISWGEAMLSGGGIAMATTHVDAHIRNQPGLEIKELFLPTNAIFIQTSLTDTINLEAYYQTEWHPAFIDPAGSYFSEFDSLGIGGSTFTFVSGHEKKILGKDLLFNDPIYSDPAFAGFNKGRLADCINDAACGAAWQGHFTTPESQVYSKNLDKLLVFLPTTCDQNSTDVERRRCQGLVTQHVRTDKARDSGQFGLAFTFFMENGDELGLYFINYHEKIPNFILPIDAIQSMAPIIDLLVRVADRECYDGGSNAAPTCIDSNGKSLKDKGGFKGIDDLSGQLSLPQINALLLFLSALPEDQSTIGQLTFDLVRNPQNIFGDNPSDPLQELIYDITQGMASDPLKAAIATAASQAGANLVLQQFGFNTSSVVRSINYRVQYAEDVKLLGATYSTTLGSANVATEITYRDNTPVLSADVPRTPQRARMVNWHVNMLQVFEPVELWGIKLWDFSSFVAETLVWHLPGKLPYDESRQDNLNRNRLAVQNTPNGIGASVYWGLEYHNVWTGWDIAVPIYVNWGIDGAFFTNGYRDGQVTFATGMAFKHLSGVEIGWGMSRFFGDSDDIFQMLTQDRDNVTVHFKYGF